MFKKIAISCLVVVVASLFMSITTPNLYASTAITTYGTVTIIAYVHGSTGLINHILVEMENLDGTGRFFYVCRRPNLTPCLNATVGVEYQFQANMTSFCDVPGKICGEGTISSLTPLSSF